LAKTRSCDRDVVVVGGGVSGIWAAIAAARAGARVGLVERNARPGEHIICAEGVSADPLARFVKPKPEWVACTIDRVCLVPPFGETVEVVEPGTGLVLHKDLFLRGLAELAISEGAQMHLGSEATNVGPLASGDLEVTVTSRSGTAQRTVRCGAVVAADGLECRIGRQLGLAGTLRPAGVFLCAQYSVSPIDVDPHAIEFHFGSEVAPGGYAWVFPKGESTANLGVGVTAKASTRGRSVKAPSPMEWLARFRDRRAPASEVLRRIVGGVPAEREPYKGCGRGIFLAGDAARVADPATGAGIVPGMASGEISGRFAARYATGSEAPQRLEKEFARAMRAEFRDRKFRWAARQALVSMNDGDLARMVALVGDYTSKGASLRSGPGPILKFMAKSMPTAFRLARHLVAG